MSAGGYVQGETGGARAKEVRGRRERERRELVNDGAVVYRSGEKVEI